MKSDCCLPPAGRSRFSNRWLCAIVPLALLAGLGAHAAEPPTDWIDPATGHRIIRLSQEPGTASLYFNQRCYSADGKKLIVTTADHGIAAIDLESREITPLVKGPVRVIMTGPKTGDVYFIRQESDPDSENRASVVFAANVSTGAERRVVELPPRAQVSAVNADETLLFGAMAPQQKLPDLGSGRQTNGAGRTNGGGRDSRFMQADYEALDADGKPMTYAQAKEFRLHQMLAAIRAGPARQLFVIDTGSGGLRVIHEEHEWLNHLQFSPTDPGLVMFCHEGPWHEVDRLWTIRTDGSDLTKVHTRTMNMEIWGHEFFGADGSTIWYDLQRPRGEDFWLAGYEVKTGHRTWYHLQRNEWSVHFNVSPDGTMFAGDGGDSEMVAHAPDGKWIYLFRPERLPDVAGIKNPSDPDLIDAGFFHSERLVNMADHDYRLEPNVSFTPDMKWIVFRSNMHGAVHTYAVEIAKAGDT